MENFTLSFGSHSIDWDALPDQSKKALAVLGFSTKLQNCIAGKAKAILGQGAQAWSADDCAEEAEEFGLLALWGEVGQTEPFARALCAAMQSRQFEAIASGIEPKARGGRKPKLSEAEQTRRAVAIDLLSAKAKAQGKALPKRSSKDEKAAFEEFVSKALSHEAFAKAVEKEIAERAKKAAKPDFDLDELL